MTVGRKHAIGRDIGAIGQWLFRFGDECAPVDDSRCSKSDGLAISIEDGKPSGDRADVLAEEHADLGGRGGDRLTVGG